MPGCATLEFSNEWKMKKPTLEKNNVGFFKVGMVYALNQSLT